MVYKQKYLERYQKDEVPNVTLRDYICEKITLSKKSEQFSEDYVSHSVAIYEKAFLCPAILALVTECETMGSESPFAFISALHIMSTKSKVDHAGGGGWSAG